MFNLLATVDLSQAVSSTVANGDIDINQIAQLSNGNPVVMLALGAVGILGGKKVWDWLKQRQEQKHEEKLAEIEAQNVSVSTTGHEQCVAKQEELQSQVVSLKAKINELVHKSAEAEKQLQSTVKNANENFETIDEEVKKLKKKLKKIQEEIEEQEEKAKKSKKKKVKDEDDE